MAIPHQIHPVAARNQPLAVAPTLLVATDGSERSDGALRAALDLAHDGSHVRLVAVLPSLPIVSPEAQLPITPEYLAARRADLHRDIEKQVERVGLPDSGRVTVEIDDGDP